MPLPHPHGNGVGQIAENSSYDTGNTPGSTGGKFIGFGEQATSANGNRAHWALSENIDHIYQEMLGEKAIPVGASHTTIDQGSGGQQTYLLSDDVFCGDATYPGTNGIINDDYREGMLLLFSVLDAQYNELQDGSGNEIRVQEVRNSGDTADEYKNGFVTNVLLKFEAVNPVTGVVVTADYIIPTGTDIRILYGQLGSMEGMPVDIFTRYKVFNANEVEAGALFQDGTRPMTGNLDFDGNDAINLDEVKGVSGSPLDIISLSSDLNLVGGQELTFKDQYVTTPVPFSEAGHTALLGGGLTNSLLAAVNGSIALNKGWHGNRTMQMGGAISYTPATGAVELPPGMIVAVNGTGLDVGGKALNATAGADRYGVIDANGDYVERLAKGSIVSTDVIVNVFNWNGVDTFTRSDDLRWPMDAHTGCIEFTVSATRPGADFDNLSDPLRIISELMSQTAYPTMPISGYRIVVHGYVLVNDPITLPAPAAGQRLSIVGPGGSGSGMIRFGTTSAENGIDFNGWTVELKDLDFDINTGVGAPPSHNGLILNLGDNSVVRDVEITHTAGNYLNMFYWAAGMSAANILFDHCNAEHAGWVFINAEDATSVTGVTVQNCVIWGNTIGAFVILPHDYNTVQNCQLGGIFGTSGQADLTPAYSAIRLGHAGKVTGCYISSNNDVDEPCIECDPDATGEADTDDLTFTVRDNFIHGYRYGVLAIFTTVVSRELNIIVDGNTFQDFRYAIYAGGIISSAVGDSAKFTISNNKIMGASSGAYATISLFNYKNAIISGNVFWDNYGDYGMVFSGQGTATVSGNVIYNTGVQHGIYLYQGTYSTDLPVRSHRIVDNVFYQGGLSAIYLEGAPNVTVEGNMFDGNFLNYDILIDEGASYEPSHFIVTNNLFKSPCTDSIRMLGSHTHPEARSWLIANNHFVQPPTGTCIQSFGPSAQIRSNVFVSPAGTTGTAIALSTSEAAMHGMVIEANYFNRCAAGTNASVIYASGSVTNLVTALSIHGNVFEQCGSNNSSISTSNLISLGNYVNGAKITDNFFIRNRGPQNGAGTFRCIYVSGAATSGEHKISGNVIYEDENEVTGYMTTGTYTGIEISTGYCEVSNNHFIMEGGSFALAGTSHILINVSSQYTRVTGNYFGDHERTGVTTTWTIRVITTAVHVEGNIDYSDWGMTGTDFDYVNFNHNWLAGGDIEMGNDFSEAIGNYMLSGDLVPVTNGGSAAADQLIANNFLVAGSITWYIVAGAGSDCVVVGNICVSGQISNPNTAPRAVISSNRVGINILWTSGVDQLVGVGNLAGGIVSLSGGATNPGVVVGNVSLGGATVSGSHNTTGNV